MRRPWPTVGGGGLGVAPPKIKYDTGAAFC